MFLVCIRVYIDLLCNSNQGNEIIFPKLVFTWYQSAKPRVFFFSSRTFFFYTSFEAPSMAVTATGTASASETQSSTQDSSNVNDPLFLHHGENPGAVLVSQPLIGGENYPAWAWSVRKSLIAKNKLGFINGSLTLSSPIVNSPSAIQAWIREIVW